MSLKSSNKVDTNRYELTIAVPADEFEDAVSKVFKRESKKITIPGFRKGKAPVLLLRNIMASRCSMRTPSTWSIPPLWKAL